ncbi:unnamed protein product [Diamesa serratosioi]
MDLVELTTQAEATNFLSLCAKNELKLNRNYYHIGGSRVGVGYKEFYWMTTGETIEYPMSFATGEPKKNDDNNYLTIQKAPGAFKFKCTNSLNYQNFICQRIVC